MSHYSGLGDTKFPVNRPLCSCLFLFLFAAADRKYFVSARPNRRSRHLIPAVFFFFFFMGIRGRSPVIFCEAIRRPTSFFLFFFYWPTLASRNRAARYSISLSFLGTYLYYISLAIWCPKMKGNMLLMRPLLLFRLFCITFMA